MYYNALIITLAVSLVANIFLSGYMCRFKWRAEFWKHQYDDVTTPVIPPDPYEGVKTVLEYDWEEVWD